MNLYLYEKHEELKLSFFFRLIKKRSECYKFKRTTIKEKVEKEMKLDAN